MSEVILYHVILREREREAHDFILRERNAIIVRERG